MPIICIAGQDVKEKYVASLKGVVGSEELCGRQLAAYKNGFCEAHIVRSMYGYSLRYASGINDFALIARARDIGGTKEAAIEYAKKWQAQDPKGRCVTMLDTE